MYLLISQATVKKHNIIILIIMKMIEIVIVIIKRGSSLKASQFFYPQGSNNDYIMLLSIFPVESSFPCEHGTHEYAGYKRFSVFQVREIFCNTTF